jgi:hypothetical protein
MAPAVKYHHHVYAQILEQYSTQYQYRYSCIACGYSGTILLSTTSVTVRESMLPLAHWTIIGSQSVDVLPSTIASIHDPSADRSTLNVACFTAFDV